MQEAGFSRDKDLEEMNDSSGVSVIDVFLRNAFAHIPIKLASSWRVRTTDASALDAASGPRPCFMLSVTFRRSMESPFWFVLLPNLGTINFTFSSLHQVLDGYFVHYFAPKDLPPLPKNVVFVLDSSASMVGTKLRQVSLGYFFLFHVCRG